MYGRQGRAPRQRHFVPAAGLRFLAPLYDPFLRHHSRESLWRSRLVEQMRLEPGQRILDVGCGTGSQALLIKEAERAAEVVGLDPDPDILVIAGRKADQAGVRLRLDLGFADRLPYADASFDRVVSSLVFHHLAHETKVLALQQAYRVLRSGGELHLADLDRPRGRLMRVAVLPIRLLDGMDRTADNIAGRLPALIAEAGFSSIAETASFFLGALRLYRAVKPSSEDRVPRTAATAAASTS